MHDITNQDETLYPFAHAATTKADTVQARRILKKVYNHLADFVNIDMRPSSVSFINGNRRTCRIIFYDLDKLFAQKDLFMVIFYASKREGLTEQSNVNFFETDWGIAMSMLGTNDILCYASQELPDGNWFNIVLFTKEIDKHQVTSSETHHYAAYDLAPKRFQWIRLHNALIPGGIMDHKGVAITKTKYYNFDNHWFAIRQYQG
jgi:hypothetical protein